MNLTDACTFASRLVFRTRHEPTQSARTLRVVLDLHRPDAVDDSGTVPVICLECHTGTGEPADYPCATIQAVALELAVPLPESTVYEALTDG